MLKAIGVFGIGVLFIIAGLWGHPGAMIAAIIAPESLLESGASSNFGLESLAYSTNPLDTATTTSNAFNPLAPITPSLQPPGTGITTPI